MSHSKGIEMTLIYLKLKLKTSKCKLYFDQFCYSSFQRDFSIPSLLGYNPSFYKPTPKPLMKMYKPIVCKYQYQIHFFNLAYVSELTYSIF